MCNCKGHISLLCVKLVTDRLLHTYMIALYGKYNNYDSGKLIVKQLHIRTYYVLRTGRDKEELP